MQCNASSTTLECVSRFAFRGEMRALMSWHYYYQTIQKLGIIRIIVYVASLSHSGHGTSPAQKITAASWQFYFEMTDFFCLADNKMELLKLKNTYVWQFWVAYMQRSGSRITTYLSNCKFYSFSMRNFMGLCFYFCMFHM